MNSALLLLQQAPPDYWLDAGCRFAEREQFAAAIPHLMKALDGAQSAGDLQIQALIFRNLAAIYRELGNADLAERFQRQALALVDSVGAEELLEWSADALLAGKTRLALGLVEQAAALAEDWQDIGLLADTLGQRGLIAARQGRLRAAVRLFIRAARGHDFVRDDRSLGVDLQNLAEVCGLMDRIAWQRAFLSAARDCFRDAGMPRSESRASVRLRQTKRLEQYRRTVAKWN